MNGLNRSVVRDDSLSADHTEISIFNPGWLLLTEKARSQVLVSRNSKYGDNIWDFSVEHPDLPPLTVTINFQLLSFSDGTNITSEARASYAVNFKEYCRTLIIDPPHKYQKWSTCCRALTKGVRNLFRYMFENRIEKLSELVELDIKNFLDLMRSTPNKSGKPVSNRTLRSRIYGLSWLYEQSPKMTDGLNVWPYGECSTETEWVDRYAEEYIGRTERTTLEMPDVVAKAILTCAIEDLKNIELIKSIFLAVENSHHTQRIWISKNGKKVRGTLFPGAALGVASRGDFNKLVSRVKTASYIIVAFLSGMRFHEIAHMKHGRNNNWHEETIFTDNGIRTFYFVVSKTNKLQARASTYRWQTVPFVKQALEAVEICNQGRISGGNPYLFSSARGIRAGSSALNESLKDYVKHHGIKYDGRVWPLATHQFRKKFARIMIRQGLGLLALQDQLKHFDIQMTKGYGDLNLYMELQQDKFLLSSEKYDELLSGQHPVIGGGAAEVMELRKKFTGMTRGEREQLLSDLPKKAMIEQMDDGLCMYRPAKALCGGDGKNCRPADCNNSIMPASSLKKTLYWRRTENYRMLNFFKSDPLKVSYLRARNAEVDKLIIQLEAIEV